MRHDFKWRKHLHGLNQAQLCQPGVVPLSGSSPKHVQSWPPQGRAGKLPVPLDPDVRSLGSSFIQPLPREAQAAGASQPASVPGPAAAGRSPERAHLRNAAFQTYTRSEPGPILPASLASRGNPQGARDVYNQSRSAPPRDTPGSPPSSAS